MRIFPILLTFLVSASYLADAGRAQDNLVQNGRFQSDLDGWLEPLADFADNGGARWDGHDSLNRLSSGSLFLRLIPDDINVWEVKQCVAIEGGKMYQFGAKAAILGRRGPDFHDVLMQVDVVDVPDCGEGRFAGGGNVAINEAGPEWRDMAGHFMTDPDARSAQVRLLVRGGEEGSLQRGWFDEVFLREGLGTCRPFFSTLCLGGNRFEVFVSWEVSDGSMGSGTPVSLTDDSAVFWFFSPNNLELNVKVLEACASSGHFWVFASASTDVGVQLQIRDTVTGRLRHYRNPVGQVFQTITDTEAFPCS